MMGHNGNNESNVGPSTSLGLAYFSDKAELRVPAMSTGPIDLWIPRQSELVSKSSRFEYEYVNLSSNLTFKPNQDYLINVVVVNSTNATFHIDLKPTKLDLAYLMIVKFGAIPVINRVYIILYLERSI